jgi:voltage-gated potassium channel
VSPDRAESRTDAALEELFHPDERIPFVYWHRFSGAKTTVLVAAAVAVLAFVTGLSHLSRGVVAFDGPLAGAVPGGAVGVVRFAGVLVGFLLGAAAVGLQRRLRVAWWATATLLPLAAALPLVTADPTDALLFVLSLLAIPLVVRNRDRFDQAADLSPLQIAAMVTLVAVQVYGTVGAYVLRAEYTGIETWTDAFYYIVVTGTTVGYGDATPVSPDAKLFTLSVLIVGTAAFGAAFGSFLVPALESRVTAAFGNMTAAELTLLEDHVVVLGYSDLTEPLLEELADATDVVVVTPDTDRAAALDDRGVSVLTADPTDEEALRDAGIEAASGVVAATDDDARDALAIIAARQANPDVRIVAAATEQQHVDKLAGVGADRVVSPAVIGGRLLGRSVLGEEGPVVDVLGDEGAADAADDEPER